MDDKQRAVFCRSAADGIAMGLGHRFEWFVNALRMLNHMEYSKIEEGRREIEGAFLAFEKTTASCPEEEEDLQKLTIRDYHDKVGAWYHR